jgi:hypothetical protein
MRLEAAGAAMPALGNARRQSQITTVKEPQAPVIGRYSFFSFNFASMVTRTIWAIVIVIKRVFVLLFFIGVAFKP